MARPSIDVTVEFAPDGRCGVRTSEDPSSAGRVAPASGGDFRCPLPFGALAADRIVLRVVAPPGAGPSRDSFPRLDWYREGDRVIGTATLPAAPSFVSLRPGPAFGASAPFGWNFYGFFVFAAAFIALYFAWAAWMSKRDRARTAAS